MESQDLLSPKQVARALGVSESSLKRWCDQGLIATVRTAGGHRKIQISEALRFARAGNYPIVAPEVLELPVTHSAGEAGLPRGRSLLREALLDGNDSVAHQVIFDLYLAGYSVSVICDEVIAGAFRDIGDRWACHEADVYQERRGCGIALRVLYELRRLQPQPSIDHLALGGTIQGDAYSLAPTMAELVLRGIGWNAIFLGSSLPISSLIKAIHENRPGLFWLSVSYVDPSVDFISEFGELSKTCTDLGVALAVGGRALTEDLRRQMVYSAYCDTMQQLESFAKTLIRHPTRGAASKKPSASR